MISSYAEKFSNDVRMPFGMPLASKNKRILCIEPFVPDFTSIGKILLPNCTT